MLQRGTALHAAEMATSLLPVDGSSAARPWPTPSSGTTWWRRRRGSPSSRASISSPALSAAVKCVDGPHSDRWLKACGWLGLSLWVARPEPVGGWNLSLACAVSLWVARPEPRLLPLPECLESSGWQFQQFICDFKKRSMQCECVHCASNCSSSSSSK